eukprot:TRINITY_DN4815_c0_g1_i1.p1 TRINITY_DN4815_c0_g1~~TRINITY_DN4815_c0_g1_i1.p1  ORF type:complete len:395 (-),score=84.88 TRINITY_DN4815_c0_g1_i1:103-1176(-)
MSRPLQGSGASPVAGSGVPPRKTVFTIGICAWYIVVSACLINFNKFMMNEHRFPFAIALTTAHVLVTFLSCSSLYFLKPSLFPTMDQAIARRGQLFKYFVPVSLLFIIGVVCSNLAYLYCSVPFLQFMKEWNVALVFLFSCLAGSQSCDRVKFTVIVWIVMAACMAVTGDMRFSHLGFIIQCCSQFGETTRVVLQEWLLSGQEVRLDPLTYQILVGPPTLATLAVVNIYYWNPLILPALHAWWPYILANAACAVLLNVTIALLIKHAGGVAFVLSGIVKDIVIVTSSAYLTGVTLCTQQIIGFLLASLGIAYWGLLKSAPSHPLAEMLPNLLGSAPLPSKAESMPIAPSSSKAKGNV